MDEINKEDVLVAVEELRRIKATILKSSVALANAAAKVLDSKVTDISFNCISLKAALADFTTDLEILNKEGL